VDGPASKTCDVRNLCTGITSDAKGKYLLLLRGSTVLEEPWPSHIQNSIQHSFTWGFLTYT
jgi:hypothetical protein